MLFLVFQVDVVAFLHERGKAAYVKTAREELSLVFVGVDPCLC